MNDKITSVFFFPHGQTACFNDKGEQVGELQKSWLLLWIEHAEKLGYDVKNLKEIKLPGGDAKLHHYESDGEKCINWSF